MPGTTFGQAFQLENVDSALALKLMAIGYIAGIAIASARGSLSRQEFSQQVADKIKEKVGQILPGTSEPLTEEQCGLVTAFFGSNDAQRLFLNIT